MSSKRPANPLGYEPIGKLLLKFALPAVISMLTNALYNIVDQIFIGRGVGYLGNAATVIAFPLVNIVLAISTMLGAGGSAYAAIKLGEKREEEAEKTLCNVFLLLCIIGVAIMVLGLVFLEPILRAFGATETTMEYAKQYTTVMLIGVPFNMLGIGLSNLSRTDGSPAFSMYSILAGAILNTILDPIYIFVFHWGVFGAAIATITSQIISAALLIWYFLKKGTMRLRPHLMHLDMHICCSAATLGISSCILQLAATVLNIILNNSLVYYGDRSPVGGDVALTAMGIVMKVSMILISICIGIGIGSQPILGFNRGANQPRRVRQTYLTAVAAATVLSVLGWLACITIPDVILQIFGTDDPNFTAFSVKCMRIFMLGSFCAGFQIVSTSYFQATGQPLKSTILSTLRQLLLLIPFLLIFPLFFGLDGLLYAGPTADILSGLVVLLFILFEMKRLAKWIRETDAAAQNAAPDAG